MQTLKTRLKDTVYVTGLLALLVSLAVFTLPLLLTSTLNNFSYFTINFLITATYFFILLFSGRLKKGVDSLSHLFLLLILFLISAYSLNRDMNVFESSVSWLSVTLVVVSVNYIAFSYFETYPRIVQHLMCFVLGIAFCLFIYLSVYLIPLYLISAIAFFLLGISLHTFVPVLFLLFSIRLIRRTAGRDRNLKRSFYAGGAAVAVLLIVFVKLWSDTTDQINTTYRYCTSTNENFPAWVSVAQVIPCNAMTEKLLKTSLVYAVPGNNDNFFWRMPSRNFDEQKKHDPFIMIASLLSDRFSLENNDRIKILESQYDSRHQAQQRLWSGESLQTVYVNTNVRIWQQFSIAYTEKTITVLNNNKPGHWPLQEEAIYTFHLPEGGVVSSLSLWINGKEEKGLLTTKEKAARAYNTIVGAARRDPSVVHWQEGNTVSVRVFPVITGKSRMFRIGVTAPLQKSGSRLIYDNIYFDGPASSAAGEDLSVSFDQKQQSLAVPASLNSADQQHYTSSGKYNADWSASFAYEGLSAQGFSFNGKSYSISPYVAERKAALFNTVYLDINSSWTKHEFEAVYNLVKDKHVYVYNNQLIGVNESNKTQLFETLSSLRFSLFPVYEIRDAATALMISKSGTVSLNLSDLGESSFMDKTKAYLNTSPRIRLFNLGVELSPYLKTLLECRTFNFEQGNPALLNRLVRESIFAADKEDSNHVVIHNAALVISETDDGGVPSVAPDHLMRLYAYNHIMQHAGKKLLTNVPEDDDLVKSAKTTTIVTPFSSLVVLESQEDYDRFKITPDNDSLGNASLKSKGSVPEPHEWLLILTALSVLFYIRFKPFHKNIKPVHASR